MEKFDILKYKTENRKNNFIRIVRDTNEEDI